MKKLSTVIFMILSVLLGGAVGFFAMYNMPSHIDGFSSLLYFLFMIFIVCICQFLHIVIHEGGHLIFGLLSGYKFISYRIGSFMITKEDNRYQLKRFSLAGTAGQCLLSPPDYNNGHYPQFLYNLGGIFLNIITSLIAFVGYFMFNDIPYLNTAFLIFGIIGIYFASTNGIPLIINGMNNDGYNAYHCYKDEFSKKAFWISLKVNALNSVNIRLKDMNTSYFEDISLSDMRNSLASSLLLLNLNHAMDAHSFTHAKDILQFINDNTIEFISIHKYLIQCEEFYIKMIEHDFSKIDSFTHKTFQKFLKSMKNYPAVIRTQYTYELLYNMDPNSAQVYLDRFQKVKKTYPNQMDIDSEQELMDYAFNIYTQKNL